MANLNLICLHRGRKLWVSLFSLCIWLILPLIAQAQTKQLTPMADRQPVTTETIYRLGAGDRIQVNIYQVEEFSGPLLILVDGTASFPLLGSVKVEGMTLDELNALLTQQYAVYIKRPVVTTSLIEPRPLRVTVAGEVNSPGVYSLPFSNGKYPTITDLIQLAGGLTATADIKTITLRRFLGDNQKLTEINLGEILKSGNSSQNLTLRDRDSVIIPTSTNPSPADVRELTDANFGIRSDQEINVAVVGEVYRPGSYKFSPNRTNVQDATRQRLPRLTDAIRQAGGIKQLANIREVELRRVPRSGEAQVFVVDLWDLLTTGNLDQNLTLQDGDMIMIPQAESLPADESETLAIASFAPDTIRINVVGEVVRPGAQELQPNTPLNQAILAAGGFDKRRAKQGVVEVIRLNENGTVIKKDIPVDFAEGLTSENNPALRNNDVVIVNRNALTATTDTLRTVLSPLGALTGVLGILDIFGVFDNN
ncbi:MAG: SLBB domain-containing protein [Microcystaceae cyanobacterium]